MPGLTSNAGGTGIVPVIPARRGRHGATPDTSFRVQEFSRERDEVESGRCSLASGGTRGRWLRPVNGEAEADLQRGRRPSPASRTRRLPLHCDGVTLSPRRPRSPSTSRRESGHASPGPGLARSARSGTPCSPAAVPGIHPGRPPRACSPSRDRAPPRHPAWLGTLGWDLPAHRPHPPTDAVQRGGRDGGRDRGDSAGPTPNAHRGSPPAPRRRRLRGRLHRLRLRPPRPRQRRPAPSCFRPLAVLRAPPRDGMMAELVTGPLRSPGTSRLGSAWSGSALHPRDPRGAQLLPSPAPADLANDPDQRHRLVHARAPSASSPHPSRSRSWSHHRRDSCHGSSVAPVLAFGAQVAGPGAPVAQWAAPRRLVAISSVVPFGRPLPPRLASSFPSFLAPRPRKPGACSPRPRWRVDPADADVLASSASWPHRSVVLRKVADAPRLADRAPSVVVLARWRPRVHQRKAPAAPASGAGLSGSALLRKRGRPTDNHGEHPARSAPSGVIQAPSVENRGVAKRRTPIGNT